VEILGIDVGGSGIKGAPVDVSTGELTRQRHRTKTPDRAEPDAVGRAVAGIVKHFAWEGPIGCAFPARIKKGVAHTAANIDPSWIGLNVAELFQSHAGMPFLILNDADAAGIAEMNYGAGRDRRDIVLLLTVGTGIGSALFNNQMLLPNTEFGHFFLQGVVAEHYASDKARKDDKLSWKQWAGRFQEYLTHLERLFDLDLIILGGGISKDKKKERYLDLIQTHADLITAELQNDAGIIGAACSAKVLVDETVPSNGRRLKR
jgi:polyphosphate glucokinase